jgi:hypothetical protein
MGDARCSLAMRARNSQGGRGNVSRTGEKLSLGQDGQRNKPCSRHGDSTRASQHERRLEESAVPTRECAVRCSAVMMADDAWDEN